MARYLERPEMDKILSLSKRRGFVFQSSEIYGGINATWDYGPLGAQLKRNLKELWWRSVVQERDDVVGLDAAILMHPQVWVTSGHVESFADPFSECTFCGRHYRADQIWDLLWESPWWQSLLASMHGEKTSLDLVRWAGGEGSSLAPNLALVLRPEVTISWISDLHTRFHGVDLDFQNFVGRIACRANGMEAVPCPYCGGEVSEPVPSNLMLETLFGPVRETAQKVYLRPETAQGIFVNFANVLMASRRKLPFGIAQIGKAFRNEITPGNFTFRTREFEQMELEYFVRPGDDEGWLHAWVEERFSWYVKYGVRRENLRLRRHQPEELAHYAKDVYDIEYHFPWGWGELEGIANRTDFDLRSHAEASGEDLTFFDDVSKERFFPYVIEPSGGVDRAALAFWLDSYDEEPDPPPVPGQPPSDKAQDVRVVLHLHRRLAPVTVAVLPLSRNEKLAPLSSQVWGLLRPHFSTQFDDAQSIGRRYRRQDEIGTPWCITVDFQSLEDKRVTLRDRDTMAQLRIPIADLSSVLQDKLEHGW